MARVLEKISTDRPSLGDAALDKYKESADWPSPTGVEAANDPGAGSDRDEVSVATANPEPDEVDGAPESFACMDAGDTIGVGSSFSRVKIAVVRPSADSDEGARVCAIKVCHKARILEADEVVSILRERAR
ncbi:hypothetical protein SO694_00028274 [Aureococcus anophagefferens]|uniref:Protein kinase domain-containing protein n=1 Tax=Aureococcus anophagefferens TaxID=44056 RepID=A0ABR1FVJ4_AURAN